MASPRVSIQFDSSAIGILGDPEALPNPVKCMPPAAKLIRRRSVAPQLETKRSGWPWTSREFEFRTLAITLQIHEMSHWEREYRPVEKFTSNKSLVTPFDRLNNSPFDRIRI